MTKYIEIDGIGEVVPRSEYDALAAQVWALRDKLSEVVALLDVDGMTAVQWLLDNCPEIESLTNIEPEQHLAEVKAEAIHEAIEYATENYGEVLISELVEYADSIRKGGAK